MRKELRNPPFQKGWCRLYACPSLLIFCLWALLGAHGVHSIGGYMAFIAFVVLLRRLYARCIGITGFDPFPLWPASTPMLRSTMAFLLLVPAFPWLRVDGDMFREANYRSHCRWVKQKHCNNPDKYHERNPLLGKHPSIKRVDTHLWSALVHIG